MSPGMPMMPPQQAGGENPLIQLLMALAMEEQGEQPGMGGPPGMMPPGMPGMMPPGGQDPMAMIMAMLGGGGGMPGMAPPMAQEPMPPNAMYR